MKRIAIALPSYKRPELLRAALEALVEHAAEPMRVVVNVIIEPDDAESGEVVVEVASKSQMWIGRRVNAHDELLPKLINRCHAEAFDADVVMNFSDDQHVATRGWDTIIDSYCSDLPGGFGVCHFAGSDCGPNTVTHPIVTRAFYEAACEIQGGWFFPEDYPFWFIDSHWDEIADLMGMKIQLPIEVAMPEGRGRTHHMRDLETWSGLFIAQTPERIDTAVALTRTFEPPIRYNAMVNCLGKRVERIQLGHQRFRDAAFLSRWQNRAEPGNPSERYLKALAKAKARLAA